MGIIQNKINNAIALLQRYEKTAESFVFSGSRYIIEAPEK